MSFTPSISASPSNLTAGSVSGASARGSHRLAAALTCERLWAFRYYRNIRPVAQKSYQLIGTLVHTVLAYWFGERAQHRPAFLDELTLEEALVKDGEGYPQYIELALEIGAWCKQRYSAEAWQPLYVEEEFSSTLGKILPDCPPEFAHEVVTCKNDLVVVWNGEAWIVDHKTSRGGNNGKLARWAEDGEFTLSFQVFQNLHILRTQTALPIAEPLRGFAINRIKRGAPFDGDRHALRPPDMAYNDAPRMMLDAVRREKSIIEKIASGERPTPNYAACEGRYGKCDYFQVCAARSQEQRDRILNLEYTAPGTTLVQIGRPTP